MTPLTSKITVVKSKPRVSVLILLTLASYQVLTGQAPMEQSAIRIDSRLELFVDHYLIDKMSNTRLEIGQPNPAEISIEFDRPWEGLGAAFPTVLKDGETFHMYYRGFVWDDENQKAKESTCYAVSKDGVHWEKPYLGLVEVVGTMENNAIFDSSGFHPFLDNRPGVPASERFKALKSPPRSNPGEGTRIYASGDGVNWKKLHDQLAPEGGPIFWSESEERYVAYGRVDEEVGLKVRQLHSDSSIERLIVRNGSFSLVPDDMTGDDSFRYSTDGGKTWRRTSLIRSIKRTTSTDLIHWSPWTPMTFDQHSPTLEEQLYTNATQPYFRAPHLYIALAARYMPGRQALSDDEGKSIEPEGMPFWTWKDVSDAVLLTSRGGEQYDRTFPGGFVRPGIGLRNWGTRTNYPGVGIVPTGPDEISFYVVRHYEFPSNHIRRYTLRTDGFASVRAPYEGGELITKPLRFRGNELVLNFSTSAAGRVRVEIQDEEGEPISGYSLEDSSEIIGDKIEHVVSWKEGSDLGDLTNRAIRLRFEMQDADLYSLRFR